MIPKRSVPIRPRPSWLRTTREVLRTIAASGLPLLLLTVAACQTPQVGRPESPVAHPDDGLARPPFDRVDGGQGATLYLLGMLHFGPPEGWSFSPEIEDVIESGSGFVVELDAENADTEEIADALAARTILPPGPPLPYWVSPETRRLLETKEPALADAGFPASARSRFEPWYVAFRLQEIASRDLPYRRAESAERLLLAERGTRPIRELETAVGQLERFHRLPMAVQDLLLKDTLVRMDDKRHELDSLARAWRIGDRAFLTRYARQGVEEEPGLEAFFVRVYDDRSREWVPALRALLDDPDRRGERWIVGVGALHLVGDASLSRLLEARGYRVERIH